MLVIYSVENLKVGRGLVFFNMVQKIDYFIMIYLELMLLITVCSQQSHEAAVRISFSLQIQLKAVA